MAMLDHYSSKSSQHGAGMLSAVIGIVVFTQTVPIILGSTTNLGNSIVQSLVRSSVFGFCLGSMIFFLFRSTARLIFWGRLATYVLSARIDEAKENEMPILQHDRGESKRLKCMHADAYTAGQCLASE